MRTLIRLVAGLQLALILPAALFLTSVLVAAGDERQYDLGVFASEIVNWYSGRVWTLWLLLFALPFVVFVTGCAALTSTWNYSTDSPQPARQSLSGITAPLATLFVAGITMISAAILAIVALHMAAN